MIREIILDTETTGFEPSEGHRLVEIGCVELLNHIPSGHVFHRYINPERDMPAEAFNVHGLSAEFLADKPVFADIADEFVAFVAGSRLVIHNAAFDMRFLDAELERLGRRKLPREHVLDTLMLARRKHPGGSNSLDALCARYGIDNSKRTKHGALLDAEILAEVYVELIGARQATLGLSSSAAAAAAHADSRGEYRARQRPEPLDSLISPHEQRAHEDFVDALGEKALWRLYPSKAAGQD